MQQTQVPRWPPAGWILSGEAFRRLGISAEGQISGNGRNRMKTFRLVSEREAAGLLKMRTNDFVRLAQLGGVPHFRGLTEGLLYFNPVLSS